MDESLNAISTLNAVGDGVIRTDNHLIVTFINKKACDILGKEASQIVGATIEEIFPLQTEDGVFIDALSKQVIETGKSSGLRNNSYIMNGDKKRYISASLSSMSILKKKALVINFRDITKLKQYELDYIKEKNKFESLFMSLPMGVVVIDKKYQMMYCNPYIIEEFDAKTIDEQQSIVNALMECEYLDQVSIRSNIEKILMDEPFYKTVKIVMAQEVHEAIEKKNYQIQFTTVMEDNQKDIMLLIQDITKQCAYEDELRVAREVAQEANKLKGHFLANMSHEIRTPLNGIIGMIDLTSRMVTDPDLIENLTIAKNSSRGLLRIINDVLDYSKLEANKMVFRDEDFSLKEFAKEVIQHNSFGANAKGLSLSMAFSPLCDVYVVSDRYRLEQVLNNLLNNAIKFTDKGGIKLVFDFIEKHGQDRIVIEIKVIDTGIGIKEEDLSMLFKSFVQVDGSYTRRTGGTGLGLAICKEIVESIGGKVAVQSEEGKGTTFTIDLELGIGDAHQKMEEKNDNIIANQIMGNILLVEDDRINQLVISKKLQLMGCTSDIANNGQEGIELFKENDYDLIIMDIQMPVMSGIDAIKVIRGLKKGKKIPILALTALALKEEQDEIIKHGFDMYIAKPVDLNKLSGLVNRYIHPEKKDEYMIMDVQPEKEEVSQNLYNKETLAEKIEIVKEKLRKEEESQLLEFLCTELKDYFEAQKMLELKKLAFKTIINIRKGCFVEAEKSIDEMGKYLER